MSPSELDRDIARARILMPLGGEESIAQLTAENAALKARIVSLESLPLHKQSMLILRYQRKLQRWRWTIKHPWQLRRRIAKRIYDWDDD